MSFRRARQAFSRSRRDLTYHIMFMELKSPLVKGEKVPVTLVFEKAGSVDVILQVQELGTSQPGQPRH